MTKRSFTAFILIVAIVLVIAVTAIVWVWIPKLAARRAAAMNVPFQVELSAEVVTPISTFDATSASPTVYDHVTVLDSTGHQVTVSARNQPLLFTAYWCPHCQRTLTMLNAHWSQLKHKPIVVSMGFAANTTLAQAKAIEVAELKRLGLTHITVYYMLNAAKTQTYVPAGYPTLVFGHHGNLMTMHSEHTLSVWEKALGD